ncbi:MAG: 50S ribosomal protein L29 [Nanoarchaeota archaeon]|nr:50S ribosomal protein L29 [Nanoarchaeota archaeon]MBU4308417.1 50S ribosomal protein L29 [Nanoarchaeota archaeon]
MKFKEIIKMEEKDREKKLKDLKMELIKSQIDSAKKGNSKAKEIKKMIAQILTFNHSKEALKNK